MLLSHIEGMVYIVTYFYFLSIIYSVQGMDDLKVSAYCGGIVALDSRKSKEIDLYNDYTELNYKCLHVNLQP